MRLRGFLRIAGYCALWIAVVLACGIVAALLPTLSTIGQPSSSENYGMGMAMMFWGIVGLFAGTMVASFVLMWLFQREARRSQVRSLRSTESQA
jgi:hypothetical protein